MRQGVVNDSAVHNAMKQVGADVLNTLDAGDTVLVQHTTISDLTSSRFVFG